jgi:hypothetical protein
VANLVGVKHRRAQFGEEFSHRAFTRTDSAGESDRQHRKRSPNIARRARDSKLPLLSQVGARGKRRRRGGGRDRRRMVLFAAPLF